MFSTMPQSKTQPVRVRFAPSPTGKLHIGGARTAIYNWAFARANNGVFILRIDDTDPTRSTDENTQVILRAMRWMGLDWDEGPEVGGDYGPYWQTERLSLYREAALRLVAQDKSYFCFCTAEKLEADRKAAQQRHDPFQGYQRTCRSLDKAAAQARVDAGEPYTIRIKVPEDRGDLIVHDAVHGDVRFNAKELDDFILFRSDGTPTYNFATVVDDAAMHITHVIRGDDHLSNTPRQIIVYEALGAPVPTFAHISMILGADGKKLSKRHGATSVEQYRDAGYDPEAFINYLALLGWALDGETTIIPRDVLAAKFSLDHVSKNPATFDQAKLDWINASYLAEKTDEAYAREVLVPQLRAAGLEEAGGDLVGSASNDGTSPADAIDDDDAAALLHSTAWYELLAAILKPRVKLAPEVVDKARFLYESTDLLYDQKSVDKNLAKPGTLAFVQGALDGLRQLDDAQWTAQHIDEKLAQVLEALETNKRKFYAAVRVAVCGNQVSPPLGESIELLGRELTLARLAQARQYAQE